jgi:DnaK suppressor protein
MPNHPRRDDPKHEEWLIDEAAEESFPASDPSALAQPHAHPAHLSGEFIEQQRRRLEALRDQLRGRGNRSVAEERASGEQQFAQAGDAVDKAEPDVEREVGHALRDANERHLREVERALQKIAEGSYGISDRSGAPIPKARLVATPEALVTVEEAEEEGR